MANERMIKRYFIEQYGLHLSDVQALKYRSVIGDLEAFIAFVSKKMHVDESGFDIDWAQLVLSHQVYPSLAKEAPSPDACTAKEDFINMVSVPYKEGRLSAAYEGVLEWLDTKVTNPGLARLRGAMARRANAKLRQHGVKFPRKESGKRSSPVDYLIEAPGETVGLIKDRLNGARREYFALRLGKGSKSYNDMKSEQSTPGSDAELDYAFTTAMHSSIKRLSPSDKRVGKEELKSWLDAWTTGEGLQYLRSALSSKRHVGKSESDMVSVYKNDYEYLESLRDQHGFTNLKDTLAYVIEQSRK